MTRSSLTVLASAALVLTFALPVMANDEPDELMPGRVTIIKPGRLAKFVAKAPSGGAFLLPSGTNDPTVEGGMLEIFDTDSPGSGAGFDVYPLPVQTAPLGWKRLPKNTSRPLKGYKYKGAGSAGDPCRVVLVKEKVVKGVCKGSGITLSPPFSGEIGIVLTIGTDSKRYCASFGGDESKNQASIARRKNAPAPGGCPATTSTTTTTILPGPCCGGESYVSFTSGVGSGTCGEFDTFIGGGTSIACGGLYYGGGGQSAPLPAITPDLGQTIGEITSCTGQTATLGPTTSLETLSNRNCSAVGCLYGGPLPVPNAASTPTSACVINTVTTDLSGTTDCGFGTGHVDLPLDSEIFLTGDLDAGTTGIQPCPRCVGGLCKNGPNDGVACTPANTDQGGLVGYPTSHDCPPEPTLSIGTIPIAFALDTGTVSWNSSPATNPSSGTQIRVFCGYCRDSDITGNFQDPFQQCWENGVAVGGACTQPNESCEQRTQGAFGPGGGGVKTITAIGEPAGSIVDSLAHSQTLVSVFCIPPTADATINNAADLPGPGTVAIEGETELCSTPTVCPD